MAVASRAPTTDLGRMQEAMARMMEMQQRAGTGSASPESSGWSTDPNVPRQNRTPRRHQPEPSSPPPFSPRPQPPSSPGRGRPHGPPPPPPQGTPHSSRRQQSPPPPPPPPPKEKSDTTLLQDILNGIGLDDDRVLILGLILILINAKADTTLILALCYLLF